MKNIDLEKVEKMKAWLNNLPFDEPYNAQKWTQEQREYLVYMVKCGEAEGVEFIDEKTFVYFNNFF